jgi:hypothetical protein
VDERAVRKQRTEFWEDDPAWRPLNLESGGLPCDRVLPFLSKIKKVEGRKAGRDSVRSSDAGNGIMLAIQNKPSVGHLTSRRYS